MGIQPVLLWDFDGTLADTHPYWEEAILGVVAERGGAMDAATLSRALDSSSAGVVALINMSLDAPLPPEKLLGDLWERVHARLQHRVPWLPGVRRLLREAADTGTRCGLVSNSPVQLLTTAVNDLEANPFACITGSQHSPRSKPAPDLYRYALRALECDATDALAIEDSGTGIRAAHSAGVRCVHVGPKPLMGLPPTAELPSLKNVTLDDLFGLHRVQRPPKP